MAIIHERKHGYHVWCHGNKATKKSVILSSTHPVWKSFGRQGEEKGGYAVGPMIWQRRAGDSLCVLGHLMLKLAKRLLDQRRRGDGDVFQRISKCSCNIRGGGKLIWGIKSPPWYMSSMVCIFMEQKKILQTPHWRDLKGAKHGGDGNILFSVANKRDECISLITKHLHSQCLVKNVNLHC